MKERKQRTKAVKAAPVAPFVGVDHAMYAEIAAFEAKTGKPWWTFAHPNESWTSFKRRGSPTEAPKPVQTLLDSGALTAGHARALLSIADERELARLAREAVAKDWSVRELEQRARAPRPARARSAKGKGPGRAGGGPESRRIEDALRKKLGTDAHVVHKGQGKGHVSLRFYSSDDLARLLELILGRRWDG